MILIDPELDPSAWAKAPRQSAGSVPALGKRSPRRPSIRALTYFLAEAQQAIRLQGKVTVLLTGDATLRDLNRRFRHKDKPTDVLSFPAAQLVPTGEKGDLAISVETAIRQGAACGHSLETELKVLILHGLLHLAGYDHETDSGQMQRRERSLRARLGLPLGLIERTVSTVPAQSTRSKRAQSAKAQSAKAKSLIGKVARPKVYSTAGPADATRRAAAQAASDRVRRGTRPAESEESRRNSRQPRRSEPGTPATRPRSRKP